jgi:raffinose/stachyose/melibiose transport system substrate-binding protein
VSKKFLALASMFVVLAMLLTSCGGTTQAPAPTTAPAGGDAAAPTEAAPSGEPTTLKVLIHQNPPMVEFMNSFVEKFQAKYPNITVDLSVVNANDLSTVTQTRLTANDVDVIDIFGFANAAQPYMKNVTPPNWQTLIDAGLLMDISDQPFVKNYDEAATKDSGTYNDKVYAVNLGRVIYSGVFYNKDLFEKYGVEVPTTWDELVAACETFKSNNVSCMTAGGKDGWPILWAPMA